MKRNAEGLLVLAAITIGALAFFTMRANSDVTDPGSVWMFATACAFALVAHFGVGRFAPNADPVILPLVTLLNLLGLTMIHRLDIAEAQRAARQGATIPAATFTTQTAWTVLGISLLLLVLAVVRDHRILQRYTYTSMLIGVVLLLMPLMPILGASINGARLWVRIGGQSFQPGEFAKLFLAIFFAGFLVLKRESLALIRVRRWGVGLPRPRDLGPILVCWAISIAVLVFQRDLGTSLLFFGLFVSMLYSATGQRTWLAIGSALFMSGATIAYFLFGHVRTRVQVWLDPFSYADAQGYQIVQSLYGLASGGLFGSGLGNGFPYLVPFAKSDFILAAIGEELGFVGLSAVLMLYAVLVQRGFKLASTVRDGFGQLLAGGLAVVLGLQTFIVAGGVTRLIPLTGLTTPFLTAGGSSLVANWIAVAVLLRISDTAARVQETE